MSETQTEAAPQVDTPAPGTGTPVDPPVAETQAEQQEETAPEPEPAPKPRRTDRHIAHLTRAAADAERARDAAEARAAAAEALLRAGREDDGEQPPPQHQPQMDVETRAAQLLAERAFSARMIAIDAAGKKEHGAASWQAAKETMNALGAVANLNFLAALAETDSPQKIFAELADDPDTLMGLLAKPPAAMAAALGRMDAKMSVVTPPRASQAPVPPRKIAATSVVPEASLYDAPATMTMAEWTKIADRMLPPHLGGTRKTA